MNGLFLFSFNNFSDYFTTFILAIICGALVVLLSLLCAITSLKKQGYGILKRLWLVLAFMGICLIEFWFENELSGQKSYLALTIGLCFLSLSICLFLPVKSIKISAEKRTLAQFLDKCAHGKSLESNSVFSKDDFSINQSDITPSKILFSPITKADSVSEKNKEKEKSKNDEIDFSHVKSILARLEFYPLKEQDKKSALELEKAILEAEENGLNTMLKQTINDGLGALLKIMAKYAV